MIFKHLFSLLFLSILWSNCALAQGYGFEKILKDSPHAQTTFCIGNTIQNLELLQKEGITVKYSSFNWLFITTTPEWISKQMNAGKLKSFHFEFAPPSLLNDTARGHHFVDSVHLGVGGLTKAYTGKNVIIGVVDTGIDYNHPDFLDSNGKTRVIRYWDHSVTGPNPPMPYNYGQEWDSTDINNGTITSIATLAHGPTVAGCAAGNGLANGTNKGIAPDANIVIIETNFNLPNWTLTIADACDYIFAVADEYNMPAVVNLSLGTYLGSHDGNDPASEYMENLIESESGRIIVAAAGNSGQWGKYHCHGIVTNDTTFTWFKNNPSNQLGPNKIYFDFWTDTATAHTMDFAFGADTPGPNFNFRGHSTFHNAFGALGTVPVFDTIFNPNGIQIATIETYSEIEGPNFHMEVLFENVDSLNYLYRFMTKGTGSYDLWSGTTIGLNEIVSTGLPTTVQMPAIVNYQIPDAQQTIVSSWNCSEKIISVGNSRNRANHIDKNGNLYIPFPSSVGELSPNSSKGPNRAGVTKPDITASGDVSLSAGPLALLNNSASWNLVDSGGWHVRNGGTSMASPVVAGIAALYLEKCPYGTAASFKTLLTSSAFADAFTGTVPNNAYGYGKAHALDLLLSTATEPTPTITQAGNILTSSASLNYQWVKDSVDLTGQTNQTTTLFAPDGYYQVYTISTDGCPSYSAPFYGVLGAKELNQTSFRLFPNPNHGTFRIETDENIIDISVIDMLGRKIDLGSDYKNEYRLKTDVSGTYILRIVTERGIAQLKVSLK